MSLLEKPRGGAPVRVNLLGETYWYHFQFDTNGSSTPDALDPSGSLTLARTATGTITVTFDEHIKPAAIHNALICIEESQGAVFFEFGGYVASTGIATLYQKAPGAAATGTITCPAKANFDDTGDTVTISDGITSKVYEFDPDGDGVSGSNVQVNIAAATTAASVAAILVARIAANQPNFTIVDNLDGSIDLTNNIVGSVGNVTITEAVTDAGFTVSGMSGGDFVYDLTPPASDSNNLTVKCSFLCGRKGFSV